MTREEAIRIIKIVLAVVEDFEIIVQGEEFTEEKCKEAVDAVIKALEQEPRWIPVSERLPEKGYSVWVTRITDDNCKYVRIASYQGDCWMDNTDEFNKPNPHKVIAWQPLPTPYEPQERSE